MKCNLDWAKHKENSSVLHSIHYLVAGSNPSKSLFPEKFPKKLVKNLNQNKCIKKFHKYMLQLNCLLEVALALRQLNLIHKKGP